MGRVHDARHVGVTYKHRGEPRQAVDILGQEGHSAKDSRAEPSRRHQNEQHGTNTTFYRSNRNKQRKERKNKTEKHLGGPGEVEGFDAH